MNKHIFTIEELFEFFNGWNNYTLFIKNKLCKRHDSTYICGTIVINHKDSELINKTKEYYKNYLYLITDIDIDKEYITFNCIGEKEELLEILKGE